MAAYIYFVASLYYGRIGTTYGDYAIVIVCASIQGVSNICVGHELYHRRDRISKFFGLVAHMKFLSGHIPIYHNELHHKFTGIPSKDPGFSPRTNTIYDAFDILGTKTLIPTCIYEDQRLKKRGMESQMQRILANRVI
jgi:fatty acid desaturase